jgi:hypothetical protein
MWMKPITAFLLLSLTAVGAACSDPVAAESTTLETADAGDEVQGTLNLNVGPAGDTSGGLNLGTGSAGASDDLIVAPGPTGGNFEDVQGLDVDLPSSPDAILDTPDASAEDDVVRLKPQN